MILIKLKGGIGNQLFQYAAGRALSLRQQNRSGKEVVLKLDTEGFDQTSRDTAREYKLGHFNIHAPIASPEEIRALKYPHGAISKLWRIFYTKILRQFNVGFSQRIFNTQDDIYLEGFFQTERYFTDYAEKIREDLSLKSPLSMNATTVLNEIKTHHKSVSLHVRRGDYVSDSKTHRLHGTCDASYYAKAVEHIASTIGADIHLFIFSDDIGWVRQNLVLPYPTTQVSDSMIQDYEELTLMSSCSHHIIANSSFSWWGAWLNNNPNKIVIAPKRWVRKGLYRFKDIVPEGWIKI